MNTSLSDSERICVLSAISHRLTELTASLHSDPDRRNPRTVWEINNLENALAKIESVPPLS